MTISRVVRVSYVGVDLVWDWPGEVIWSTV